MIFKFKAYLLLSLIISIMIVYSNNKTFNDRAKTLFYYYNIYISSIIFILIYTTADMSFGNDRIVYYQDFIDSTYIPLIEYFNIKSPVFHNIQYFINIFGANEYYYFSVVSTILVAMYFITFKKYLSLKEFGLFIILLLFSKLYLIFTGNIYRTTLMGSFVLFILIKYVYSDKIYLNLLFLPLLFFIHKSMTIILLFGIFISILLKNIQLIKYLLYISIFIYLFNISSLLFSNSFFDNIETLSLVQGGAKDTLVRYGNSESSFTMTMMFVLYIIIPSLLLLHNKRDIREKEIFLFRLILIFNVTVLSLYETFSLIFRLLVISYPLMIFFLVKNKNKYVKYYLIFLAILSLIVLVKKL